MPVSSKEIADTVSEPLDRMLKERISVEHPSEIPQYVYKFLLRIGGDLDKDTFQTHLYGNQKGSVDWDSIRWLNAEHYILVMSESIILTVAGQVLIHWVHEWEENGGSNGN